MSASVVVIAGSNDSPELLAKSIFERQNQSREGEECALVLKTKYYEAPLQFRLPCTWENHLPKVEGVILVVDERLEVGNELSIDPVVAMIAETIENTPDTILNAASIKIFCVNAPQLLTKSLESKHLEHFSAVNSARVMLCLEHGFEYLHLDISQPHEGKGGELGEEVSWWCVGKIFNSPALLMHGLTGPVLL
jgi:hypothetical protein